MSCGRFGQICLATSWKLAVSVQHGQVGKFKVLSLLDSAVLEHGQVGRGLQICNVLQWPDLLCSQVESLCRLV